MRRGVSISHASVLEQESLSRDGDSLVVVVVVVVVCDVGHVVSVSHDVCCNFENLQGVYVNCGYLQEQRAVLLV